MNLNILKIILWPKDTSLKPREIDFLPGKINIITGESGTGKSSLTAIIDYCLGSGKCSIPVGIIRDMTLWYGVLLKLDQTELLLARQDPGIQQSTDIMYWQQGNDLEIPAVILGKNINRNNVINFFNQLSGLPEEAIDDSSWGNAAPSFRDMAAFNFQPQHIIANPYTLFFKADTTEHREKLKVVFPLVIGAMTSEMILLQKELKDLDKQLSDIQSTIEVKQKAAETWLADVETYYVQAQGLGIVENPINNRSGWQVSNYIDELIKIFSKIKSSNRPQIASGLSEKYTQELQAIISREDVLSQEIGTLKRRLLQVSRLSRTLDSYDKSLKQQDDRLSSVGWLKTNLQDTTTCPICSAKHETVIDNIQALYDIAEEFSLITATVAQMPSKLDSEYLTIKDELMSKESELSEVINQRGQMESIAQEQAKYRQHEKQIYMFAGKIEQALANIDQTNDIALLSKRDSLQKRIAEIKTVLNPVVLKKRKEDAISAISALIKKYASKLQLEHATENVGLNIKDLTVEFKKSNGRTDYLWEVGSGQNWVGYHIATLLAIHEYITSLSNNPVPLFVLMDQPSQVYFPETSWESISEPPKSSNGKDLSADITGVQRIFSVISDFLERQGRQFQIIITEHAGKITWENAKNINVIGNWRQGKDDFLIPKEWFATSSDVNQTES